MTRSRMLAAALAVALTLPQAAAGEEAPPAEAPRTALFLEGGLGLRHVDGQVDFSYWTPAANVVRLPLGLYAAELQASAGLRWSSGAALAVSLAGRRSLVPGNGDARVEVSGSDWVQSSSASRLTFQEVELRLGGALPIGTMVELAPFASLEYREIDDQLRDTVEWSRGTWVSSRADGPTFAYRGSWRSAWVGLAAVLRPIPIVPGLSFRAEGAACPWLSARYQNDNLTRQLLHAGQASGSGWRAGISGAFAFRSGDRLQLEAVWSQTSAEGATSARFYAGPAAGRAVDLRGETSTATTTIGIAWARRF